MFLITYFYCGDAEQEEFDTLTEAIDCITEKLISGDTQFGGFNLWEQKTLIYDIRIAN